jgi:plasminogen activator inhibitor 1 RNA-binding protein
MTSNPFDLLGDVDSDDHSQLIAAAEKKAAAKPAPAAPAAAKPAAKLPTKPPPPGQAGEFRSPPGVFSFARGCPIAGWISRWVWCCKFRILLLLIWYSRRAVLIAVEDGRNFRDGAGRGRGGRGGRNGPRRDYGDADANGGFQGGYGGGGGGGFGGGGVARGGEDGEGRGRGPRQPYRGGGGRRGGYTEGQTTDDYGRPHRSYERRSGTGREYGMKRDGAGRGNWGTVTDEGLPQLRLVMFKLWFYHLLLLFGCDV